MARRKRKGSKDAGSDTSTQVTGGGSIWATDPALMRDAASIQFSWATGTEVDMGSIPALPNNTTVIPGLHTEYLIPSVGYSEYATSPINIAATADYSFIRHANSGHQNYDSPDLMLYIMGMSNVYAYINFLQRAYGKATLYSGRNRYLPETLLRADFIDPDDMQTHLADFRYGINVLINKAASFAVPAEMTMFKRQADLYKAVYTEGTSIKDQMYQYAPAGFWHFTYDSDNAGMLELLPFVVTTTNSQEIANFATTFGTQYKYYKVSELLEYGNVLLAPFLQSEDMNIMSGDILKAYTQSGIIGLASLPTEYPMLPIFEIGTLEQMKNATILPSINTSQAGFEFIDTSITQSANKGYLVSTPGFRIDDYSTSVSGPTFEQTAIARMLTVLTENRLLTTTTADVTPELIMESTRLMVGAKLSVPSSTATIQLYSGSEIAIGALLWTLDYNRGTVTPTPTNYAYCDVSDSVVLRNNIVTQAGDHLSQELSKAMALLNMKITRHAKLENFRFHAQLHDYWLQYDIQEVSLDFKASGFAFDVDNYALLTASDLERLHEAALLNMLHVPSIAKLS